MITLRHVACRIKLTVNGIADVGIEVDDDGGEDQDGDCDITVQPEDGIGLTQLRFVQ